MRKYSFSLCLLSFTVICNQAMQGQIKYPDARKEPFDTVIFKQKISDEYYWMSRKNNETEMLAFSKKQGELTRHVLDSVPGTEWLQNQLGEVFDELQPEIWALKPAGGYLYYNRDIPNKGTTLCRRKTVDAEEEQLLSRVKINGQSYSIRKKVFAYHKPLLALMLTQNGETNPQIRIFDLDKKEFLKDSIAPVMFNDSRGVSMNWSPDDAMLFYTQAPHTDITAEKYFRGKIKQHIIGELQSQDKTIFGFSVNNTISLTPQETPYIYSFKNSPYLVARIRSGKGDNYAFSVHYTQLNGPQTPWKKLKDYINLGDAFDANDKFLYAATTGKPRYRIVKIDMSTGTTPEEFLPEQENVIAGTDDQYNKAIIAGKDVLYVLMRKVGDMHILKVDLKTRETTSLPLPSKSTFKQLALMNENDLLFCQSSAIQSELFGYYDFKTNRVQHFPFANKVLNKSGELNTEVLYVSSRDGKSIPVSVIYSKTTDLKNNNAWLIEAYGNSGASHDLSFDPYIYPWIKSGGVYAYAHVRGGGELGDDWYKDGQFPKKINSVNDIVDIAAWLSKNNFSSGSKIMVMGASAGSFLVGNAINQRPDLFAGGIFIAGLPDMVLYTGAAGGREEKSIGPKDTEKGFASNYELSALYHIPQQKALPAMLVIHGATDYILDIQPAARYVAKYQASQEGSRPTLFLVNWEGGHTTMDPNEPVYILKFALWQTGHPDFQWKK